MQFTLLASLAIVCGVAFAAPFTSGPGAPVPDAENNVGSTLQNAGGELATGNLAGVAQDAGYGLSKTLQAALHDLGLGNINALKRDDVLIKAIAADVEDPVLIIRKSDSISNDIDNSNL